MDMHIGLIQMLKLLPSLHALKQENSALIMQACQRLQEIDDDIVHACAEKLPEEARTQEGTCITWRPKYVKDVFIFASSDKAQTILGIMESGNCQFFRSCDACVYSPDEGNVVYMGHVTCDVMGDSESQMVVLLYDIITDSILEHNEAPPTRYLRLLQHKNVIESCFHMGEAIFRVQWIGDNKCIDKVKSLQLPHEKDCVIQLGGGKNYEVVAR